MADTNLSTEALALAIHTQFAAGGVISPLLFLIIKDHFTTQPKRHPQNLFRSNQDTLNQLILAAKKIHLLTLSELNDLSHEIKKTGGFDAYLRKLLTIQEPDQEGVLMLLTFLSSTLSIPTAEKPNLTIEYS